MLLSASPGPAMALILRRAALRGFGGAVPTVLGIEVGLYLWALAAAAGLAALVAASGAAFLVLRVAGAVVLVYLGVRAWWTAWHEHRQPRPADSLTEPRLSDPARQGWRGFGEGVLVQLANPKAAVFMIAFYPQFVPANRPLFATIAVLALLQITLETVLYLSLAAGVARAGTWFRRSRIRQGLEVVSGSVLIALGLRVAVTKR
ncbi:MAG: LysE family translocator [Acidimicrobiia bacterium]|nr:LysE family translocator [Acidimicrobiia bacterium]